MSDSTGRILLVDDEPSLLKMMGVYLSRLGYDVTTAITTEQALAKFSADPLRFCCAVFDATMTGFPVEELALYALNANPSLFVIIASGYPLEMSAMEAIAPGRVMFLHKPFGPEMLAGAIRRMLDEEEKRL